MFIYILLTLLLIYIINARIIEKRSVISRIIQDVLSFFKLADFRISDHNEERITTDIPLELIEGRDCYHINNEADKIVIYLHGGAYLYNLNKQQADMIARLADDTNADFYIPLYPLVPYTYKETYDYIEKFYISIKKQNPDKKIILMGDSAGGGLSLGLTMLLKEKKFSLPDQLILLSPWLDLKLSNPDINEELLRKDRILDKEKLLDIGDIYSNRNDNYLLSPIHGNINNLPPVSIFTGTYDILYPDTEKLYDKLKKVNNEYSYHKYKKMLHAFVIFPIKESLDALNEIRKIINNC